MTIMNVIEVMKHRTNNDRTDGSAKSPRIYYSDLNSKLCDQCPSIAFLVPTRPLPPTLITARFSSASSDIFYVNYASGKSTAKQNELGTDASTRSNTSVYNALLFLS